MKYAVITYIFGKNKELLREPLVIDKDIEYICVTDQKDLKSKHWKIVLDEMKNVQCIRDKMVYVKYNPFKYTDADKICVIDGALEITKSLKKLFNQINDKDILIKLHTKRNNLYDELKTWISVRNMPHIALNKFQIMANKCSIDLKNKFLIESCVIVYSNSKKIIDLCDEVISYMNFLGENDNLFLSNQCVLTFLIQQLQLKIGYINQKDFFNRYAHNSKQKIY